MITANQTDAIAVLAVAIKQREPLMLVGSPGIGKTAIVEAATESVGADLLTMHPVLSDPTESKGLPWMKDGDECADFIPFGDVHRILTAKKPLVVFIDDIGQAPPAVQASFMQPVLARRIAGKPVPDCVTFLAATNRREDRAGVSGILEPVKSRFTILHLEPDVDAWQDWAVTGGITSGTRAFLNFKRDLFCAPHPTADITNSPNPRTWEKADIWVRSGLTGKALNLAIAGAVGEGAATEYMAFMSMFGELPEWDEIRKDPSGCRVPESPSSLYAVAAMVADAADITEKGLHTPLTYAQRLPEEFGVLMVRDMVRRDKKVVATKAFAKFLNTDLGKLCAGRD